MANRKPLDTGYGHFSQALSGIAGDPVIPCDKETVHIQSF